MFDQLSGKFPYLSLIRPFKGCILAYFPPGWGPAGLIEAQVKEDVMLSAPPIASSSAASPDNMLRGQNMEKLSVARTVDALINCST